MVNTIIKIHKKNHSFICDQHLVLFLILTTGIKLAIFNAIVIKVTWPTNQYIYGVIFGFLSAGILFSPLYFISKHKRKLAIILALLISTLLLVDNIYFSYFATIPNVSQLGILGQAADVGPAINGLLNWLYLLYFIDIALVAIFARPIIKYFEKIKEKHNLHKPGHKMSLASLIFTVFLTGLALLLVGPNRLNQVINSGYDTPSTAQYYGVIGAHAVDITRFINEETTNLSTEQKNTVADWVKNNKPTQKNNAMTGLAKGKNVIIIQVESLGGFVINQKVNNQEITPNLNKLSQNSQFFPNDRFIIGEGHTSDTDFVVNSSYFPISDAAVFVRYGKDDFTSLPKTLIANGYSAEAYHGFNRNFWNRNTAFTSLGYQKFYAADDYPKLATINMGLNDGDFLSKTAEYIQAQPKPSLSYAITLSSHTPFEITNLTNGLDINTNDYPYLVGGYLQNINYTDRMLGEFFTKLKSEGLYDDSLIVVYGDHTPVLPAFKAGTIDYNPDSTQQKEVPLLIKLPNETTGKTYQNTGTHMDIMPTILDLLDIKTNQLMFGQSLFAEGSTDLKVCTDQLITFNSTNDCKNMLNIEKNMSDEIIRYNLFNILPQ